MVEFLAYCGIPSAIVGLILWFFKRYIDRKDAAAAEREKNNEQLMLMIMSEARATYILASATAKAVQRIPDAHCNGDMTDALKAAKETQEREKDFLIDQGVKRIFGE